MELAGHKCVGHCEIDKYAEASYRSMHLITDEQREYLATLDIRKRQELVTMMDEGQFLTLLSEAKIPDEKKIAIAKDHHEWQRQQTEIYRSILRKTENKHGEMT